MDTEKRRRQIRWANAPARSNGAFEKSRLNSLARCDRRALCTRVLHPFWFEHGADSRKPLDGLGHSVGYADHNGTRLCRIRKRRILIDPYYIDSIIDRDGKEVYKTHPAVACRQCAERLLEDTRVAATKQADSSGVVLSSGGEKPAQVTATQTPSATATGDPDKPILAPRAIDARIAYLISSLLHDVVRRGYRPRCDGAQTQ